MTETALRDGVGLRYVKHDGARTPLVFVHGWCCDDDAPLSDLPHLFRIAPEMLFGQTVGSGHFCQLEVPEQVNAMLTPFLDVLPSLAPA